MPCEGVTDAIENSINGGPPTLFTHANPMWLSASETHALPSTRSFTFQASTHTLSCFPMQRIINKIQIQFYLYIDRTRKCTQKQSKEEQNKKHATDI